MTRLGFSVLFYATTVTIPNHSVRASGVTGARGVAAPGRRPGGGAHGYFLIFSLSKKMDGQFRRTQGGPRCYGPTFGPGVVVDTDTCC